MSLERVDIINIYCGLNDLFSSFSSADFDAYYIAKIELISIDFNSQKIESSYKKNEKRSIIRMLGLVSFSGLGEYLVKVTYFKPKFASKTKNKVATHNDNLAISKASPVIIFDKKDMKWFYENSSDSNSIHFGKEIHIPALVILKKIDDYILEIMKENSRVYIKFNEAICINETLNYTYVKGEVFELISQSTLSRKNKMKIYGVK